jgi:hypothetical protein
VICIDNTVVRILSDVYYKKFRSAIELCTGNRVPRISLDYKIILMSFQLIAQEVKVDYIIVGIIVFSRVEVVVRGVERYVDSG